MAKSETKENPGFLEYVYELNEGRGLDEAIQRSLEDIDRLDIAQLKRIGLQTYAANKWTIPQILQHLIDWERIWCFRAVLFARKEGTIPEAHDQEIMADNCCADERPVKELIEELRLLRRSTQMMFASFDADTLNARCTFFEYEMPLDAIGFTITAHQIHHFNVIEERYASLDQQN